MDGLEASDTAKPRDQGQSKSTGNTASIAAETARSDRAIDASIAKSTCAPMGGEMMA